MIDKHFQRALVLLEQHRPELAANELRQVLAADPDHAEAHGYLAMCLAQQDRLIEATAEAEAAIQRAPDWPMGHYFLANILFQRQRLPQAEASIREALRLMPYEAAFFALLGNIKFAQRDWQAALDAAQKGLEFDAEQVGCNNVRAMALTKLGRTAEASATLASTLARDPEDPYSHANQGWNLLHEGQPAKALEHFREALRRDPSFDYARAGMVEALKARYLIYGLMLRWFLWMGRFSRRAQWGIIIGGYLAYRGLLAVAEQQPQLAPFIWPLLVAYMVFALMTWISSPLFNLLLMLNRFGRHALSREQKLGATLVGLLIPPALISLVLYLTTNDLIAFLCAVYFGLLLLPVSAIFNCSAGWPRWCMIAYTLVLVALGPAFVMALAFDPPLARGIFQAFLWGSVLSGILANLMMMAIVRR